jgi:hypothetical protein
MEILEERLQCETQILFALSTTIENKGIQNHQTGSHPLCHFGNKKSEPSGSLFLCPVDPKNSHYFFLV